MSRSGKEVDSYYMNIYEDLKYLDGEDVQYYRNGKFDGGNRLGDSLYLKTKLDILSKVEEVLSGIIPLDKYERIENEFGWVYTAYVSYDSKDESFDNGFTKYVSFGDHNIIETYTIEVEKIESVNFNPLRYHDTDRIY